MYRIVRKSALLLATLTASLAMSPIVRGDVTPQQQYQPQSQNQQCVPPPPPEPQRTTQTTIESQHGYSQSNQSTQQYQQPATNNFIAPAQNTAADDKLTDEQIGSILQSFGFDPQAARNNANGTTYTVKIERGDWHFTITLALSSDHTNLWLTQSLTKLPNPQSLSPAALLKLMSWNNTNVAVFSIDAANENRIVLSQLVGNHGLSAAKLRSTIENFLVTIEQTEAMWTEKSLTTVSNVTAMRN